MPNRLTVLVAEDHPVNQKVLGLLLDSLGVRFEFAGDGIQAVEAATTSDYGLILTKHHQFESSTGATRA